METAGYELPEQSNVSEDSAAPSRGYPEYLILTAENFDACGWKDVLDGVTGRSYSSMWRAFYVAAKQAVEEGRQAEGKALWLLADACSLVLSPDSPNEPFKPFGQLQTGHRSAIPDDFNEADIAFFAEVIPAVEDPWLKGRLADLVWLIKRDFKAALTAVDSYRLIPLDFENWMEMGKDCWKRAISLTLSLGKGAGNRRAEMSVKLIEAFDTAAEEISHHVRELADLLESFNLDSSQRIAVARRLGSLARVYQSRADFFTAFYYFQSSADWFRASDDEENTTAMTIMMAETRCQESTKRLSAKSPSHSVATVCLEDAVQIYRTIPRSRRTPAVDARIAELEACLYQSGLETLNEMQVVHTSGVDVGHIVQEARASVRGKRDKIEALKAFATLRDPIRFQNLKNSAIDDLTGHPVLSLFHMQQMTHDGRIAYKRRGADQKEILESQMVVHYVTIIRLVAQARILPALDVLHLEHRFQEAEFIRIALVSAFVPWGRERLFGKALFAGFERDFGTALHLLIPQIEHFVRLRMKQAGVNTVWLNSDGRQNEVGLSTLMELPEADQLFGEDLSYEFKTLFCGPLGPNFRNNVAHGLLQDYQYWTAEAVYVWWFAFSFVFKGYLDALGGNMTCNE